MLNYATSERANAFSGRAAYMIQLGNCAPGGRYCSVMTGCPVSVTHVPQDGSKA